MAATSKKTETPEMLLASLEHPLKQVIEEMRKVILSANPELTEHIKWNAPSYCHNGDDRITFNFHAKDHIKLIFHRGAKVKDAKDFVFVDNFGLLEWPAKDRGILKVHSLQEVEEKNEPLIELVNRWVKETAI